MLRAKQVYLDETKKTSSTSTPSKPERRGVSHLRVIEEAKAKVPVADLAERLCGLSGLRKAGREYVGFCPLHDDRRTPNFYVNPEKNTWFCFVCQVGGGVVELARFAWGYEKHEMAMAAADLLHEFGHPIPERPKSRYRKQARQKPIRDAIDEAKVRHLQRRVYRIFLPMLEEIRDEGERREEIEYLWDAAGEIAVLIVAGGSGS
jgi:DNA primase